jgi:hypothetical protein
MNNKIHVIEARRGKSKEELTVTEESKKLANRTKS